MQNHPPIPANTREYDTRGARAFTLVEMLVVMGIIGILLTLAVGGFQRAAEGSAFEKALTGVSSGLEIARQTAVSESTYTWVFLAEDDLGAADGNVITMATMASKTGALPSSSTGVTASNVRLIGKVEQFNGVKFGQRSDVTDLISDLPLSNQNQWNDPNFSQGRLPPRELLPEWAQDRSFKNGKVVMFSPTGEASVDRNQTSGSDVPILAALQLVLVPSKGDSPSEKERAAASVVLVNGITGLPTVHQPL